MSFKSLRFIPISKKEVVDVYADFGRDNDGLVPLLQDIYRRHGWPNVEVYYNDGCPEATSLVLRNNFPNFRTYHHNA